MIAKTFTLIGAEVDRSRTSAMLEALAAKVDQSQRLLRERDAAVAKAERILAAVPYASPSW